MRLSIFSININWIYDFLETGLNFTEEDYKKIENRLVKLSEGKKNALKTETNSIRATVSKNDRRMREIAIGLPKLDKNSKAWEINMEEITKLEAENDKLGEEADKKQEQLDVSKGLVITLEDFLNLSKTASSKVKAGNEVQKDNILRKIFWNLSVNEKEVVTYLCKEPFATLLKDKSILNGRG